MALNLKGIDYEYRAIHLLKEGGQQHSEDYKKLNPKEEVPFLIDGKNGLGQSMAIILYLDEKYPEPKLFPKDPYDKAMVIGLCEIINSGIQPFHNLKVLQQLKKRFEINDEARDEWVRFWVDEGLRPLEKILVDKSKKYSLGDEVSALDCFLIPQIFTAKRYNMDLKNYPTLMKVFENCQKLEAFKRAEPGNQPDFQE